MDRGPAERAGALAAFTLAALVVYAAALGGPFIGDDLGYVLHNAYIHEATLENLLAVLDPFGPVTAYTANYAPVHMLAHAAEWQAFGPSTPGFHLVNVLLHAASSLLLVALFRRLSIPRTPAFLLGVLFLLHPANVEAVAWIFQLKTILALGLSLGALLLFPQRPLLATLLFALALLAKIAAVYALPVAALLLWVRREWEGRAWLWLGVWAAVFALCAGPQFAAFDRLGHVAVLEPYADPFVQARSIVAIAARYLAMAGTSYGVSAFHEPAPAISWGDPWWLAGAVLLALLGWRFVASLRARSEEAAFWLWAAASFAPISQIFPFLYPVADRYLYLILPGLLGGGFFLSRDAWRRVEPRLGDHGRVALRGAAALCVAAALAFGVHASARARLWSSVTSLHLDAARHYPDGFLGTFLAARRAAQLGKTDEALVLLSTLAARGYDGFHSVRRDPGLAVLRGEPGFEAVVAELAGNWIRLSERKSVLFQPDLRMLGLAHLARGETAAAAEALRRALAAGGPFESEIRADLRRLEARAPAP